MKLEMGRFQYLKCRVPSKMPFYRLSFRMWSTADRNIMSVYSNEAIPYANRQFIMPPRDKVKSQRTEFETIRDRENAELESVTVRRSWGTLIHL